MSDEDPIKGKYDHMRCSSCCVPLEEHTEECFRHAFLEVAISERKAEIAIEEAKNQANGHSGPSQTARKMVECLIKTNSKAKH